MRSRTRKLIVIGGLVVMLLFIGLGIRHWMIAKKSGSTIVHAQQPKVVVKPHRSLAKHKTRSKVRPAAPCPVAATEQEPSGNRPMEQLQFLDLKNRSGQTNASTTGPDISAPTVIHVFVSVATMPIPTPGYRRFRRQENGMRAPQLGCRSFRPCSPFQQ